MKVFSRWRHISWTLITKNTELGSHSSCIRTKARTCTSFAVLFSNNCSLYVHGPLVPLHTEVITVSFLYRTERSSADPSETVFQWEMNCATWARLRGDCALFRIKKRALRPFRRICTRPASEAPFCKDVYSLVCNTYKIDSLYYPLPCLHQSLQ